MDGDGPIAVGFTEKPYWFKADSGGIRFSVTIHWQRRFIYRIYLLRKNCSHEPAYTFKLSQTSTLVDEFHNRTVKVFIHNFYNVDSHDFWLTWFNDEICFGKVNEPALLRYPVGHTDSTNIIGFVKLETYNMFGTWNVECAPLIHVPMKAPKQVHNGELTWVKMNSEDALPIDALIGGWENEPLYVARATHRGSLCPGKYVKSKQHAFIPWGFEEIKKKEFEILCGYDAIWVKCKNNKIPENAFIAGYSEVHREPLFIGRAPVDKHIVVGKVHLLYKTCYLPYRQKEVETADYEVLVVGNKTNYSERNKSLCYMKMIMQPCL